MKSGPLLIRIKGHDLPGRECPASGSFPGYRDIHVGVQLRDRPTEWLDLQPGDAASVTWRLACASGLTDRKGHPLCASVRPPLISWTA